MKKLQLLVTITIALLLVTPIMSFSGDLDDGISKYTDDNIQKFDDLGKADKNIRFIVLNAKSKAAVRQGDSVEDGKKKGGDANMNSVVLGAGSKVKGDIIIIDQSTGPKTNVAD